MYAEFVSRDDMKNLDSTERPPPNVDALKRLRLKQNTLYVSKKSAVIASSITKHQTCMDPSVSSSARRCRNSSGSISNQQAVGDRQNEWDSGKSCPPSSATCLTR